MTDETRTITVVLTPEEANEILGREVCRRVSWPVGLTSVATNYTVTSDHRLEEVRVTLGPPA